MNKWLIKRNDDMYVSKVSFENEYDEVDDYDTNLTIVVGGIGVSLRLKSLINAQRLCNLLNEIDNERYQVENDDEM